MVRAAGGALNFNSNGLNVNDINDDNRNSNVAVAALVPRNFCLPFFLRDGKGTENIKPLFSQAFKPSSKHATYIVDLLLQ